MGVFKLKNLADFQQGPHQSKIQINPVCTLLFGDILKAQTGCDILKATTWRFWAFPVSLNCLGARTVSLDPYIEIPALFLLWKWVLQYDFNEQFPFVQSAGVHFSCDWACYRVFSHFSSAVCMWMIMYDIIHIEWWHGLNIFIPRVKL
jgi:hypothetical protein